MGQHHARGTRRSRSSTSGRPPDARRPRVAAAAPGGNATAGRRGAADAADIANAIVPAPMQPQGSGLAANREGVLRCLSLRNSRDDVGGAVADIEAGATGHYVTRRAGATNSRADCTHGGGDADSLVHVDANAGDSARQLRAAATGAYSADSAMVAALTQPVRPLVPAGLDSATVVAPTGIAESGLTRRRLTGKQTACVHRSVRASAATTDAAPTQPVRRDGEPPPS